MRPLPLLALGALAAVSGCADTASPHADDARPTAAATPFRQALSDEDLLARGEYLIRITGCNDCHTASYAEQQGNVDKAQWLTGSPMGYKGPWGTTYAANLRLKLADMDEAQWLDYSAKLRTRPLMPDFALRAMTQDDRRAIYRFIKSLGPGGGPAPAYLPPGQKPAAPYFELMLPGTSAPAVAQAG